MADPNFNLAPYCYLTHNGTSGKFDLSVVVPHGAGFVITFPSAPSDLGFQNTEMLIIEYEIVAAASSTVLFTSKIYNDVFAKVPETINKKIVKVLTNHGTGSDQRQYFTIQEDSDATDTLAMTGTVAKNCPHVYLPYIARLGEDRPKGLIPFDNKDFSTTPETAVITGNDVTGTAYITTTSTGVVVKMLSALAAVSIPVAAGYQGNIELRAEDNGTNPPTTIKAKTKRKNHNTQPGTRFLFRKP